MARLRIPETAAEAERFLWHAIEHISDLDARVILQLTICLLKKSPKGYMQ